jgi:hypothetical protein
VKLEAEMKKKYGEKAPPSVLGGKVVAPSQPEGKRKGKWKKGGETPPRPWKGPGT